jgi:hypothetical protein
VSGARLPLAAVWCATAWPVANFAAANWPLIQRGGAAGLAWLLPLALVVGGIGHVACRHASRRGHGAAFAAAWIAGILLVFGYAPIRHATAELAAGAGIGVPPSAGWFVAVAACAALLLALRRTRLLRTVGVLFPIAGFAAALVGLLAVPFADPPSASGERPASAGTEPSPASVSRPNVYYVVLDAHAGLQDPAGGPLADGGAFGQALESRGFQDVAADAWSNYLMTSLTLGAIFALDYPRTEDPATWYDERRTFPGAIDLPRPPPLVRALAAAGYESAMAASVWSGCPAQHFRCLGRSHRLAPDYVLQAFLAPTPFGRPLMHFVGRRRDALSTLLDAVPAVAANPRPTFVFAHHLEPHPPYLHDAECRPRESPSTAWNGWDPGERAHYAAAVRCVNRRALALVDRIAQHDPGAIVLLQSDHGPAFGMRWDKPMAAWTATAVRERASFLNSVRAPDRCRQWLRPRMGQVNTARFVVACAQGRAPEYLEERTYLSTYAEGPEHGTVRRFAPAAGVLQGEARPAPRQAASAASGSSAVAE